MTLSRYACGLMFDVFGGGWGWGLMTLVWMCFEDDVTCTDALEDGGAGAG